MSTIGDNYLTIQTLATLSGATIAVAIGTHVLRYVTNTNSRFFVVGVAFVVSIGTTCFLTDHPALKDWYLTLWNFLLLVANATGFQNGVAFVADKKPVGTQPHGSRRYKWTDPFL